MKKHNYKSREQLQKELETNIATMQTYPRYSKEYNFASVRKSQIRRRLQAMDERDQAIAQMLTLGKVHESLVGCNDLGDLYATYAYHVDKRNKMVEEGRTKSVEYHNLCQKVVAIRNKLVKVANKRISHLENRIYELEGRSK